MSVTRQDSFNAACGLGDIAAVTQLLPLDGDQRIDVHAVNEEAFRSACLGGHESIVELLLSLDGDRRIDVHTADDAAFQDACRHLRVGTLWLLLSLPPDRGYTWDTPQQQALLTQGITMALSCKALSSVAEPLLRCAPLPPNCLQLLLSCWQLPGAPPADLPSMGPHDVAVVQQVLLLLVANTAGSEAQWRARCVGLFAHDVVSSALLLCRLLLPGHAAALMRFIPYSSARWKRRVVGLTWRGVRVPVVGGVPGADVLGRQVGGVGRVGRRGLLLHRAAARTEGGDTEE